MRHKPAIPVILGLGASLAVIAFYMGAMTLTADWFYAVAQLKRFLWWILALSAGMGIQMGLFVLLRRELKEKDRKMARSTLAASGGMTTGSMVICCLHHLADVVPVLGLPVLAGFLQEYQSYFFLVAVFSNLYGIFVMVRMFAKQGLVMTRGVSSEASPGPCH